jgi:predicted dehydrogenase
MSEAMPVGVIGCGRMGKYHARVYGQMAGVKFVGVYDAIPAAAAAVAQQYHCKAFASLAEMVREVKAVTIATTTEAHAAMAETCLKAGVACMIEKPLARNSQECQQIVDWAKQAGTTLAVGHVERFNPAVRALAKMNLKPRFIETIRVSPLTFRSLDVGVVLDMMIHDIDVVLSLAKSKLKNVDAVGVKVIGQSEDVCNARLVFENGCVATMTGSRLALKTDRRMRLATGDAWIAIDYAKKQGVIARRGQNLEHLRETFAKVRSGEIADPTKLSFSDMVKLEAVPVENTDQLLAEQEDFIGAVRNGTRPTVSGEDGMAAVEVAERIVAAMGSEAV